MNTGSRPISSRSIFPSRSACSEEHHEKTLDRTIEFPAAFTGDAAIELLDSTTGFVESTQRRAAVITSHV